MSSAVVFASNKALQGGGHELAILQALAEIRAVDMTEIAAEMSAGGASAMLSSHEVVAILVALEPTTGINPRQRDVLKNCDAQTFSRFVGFVSRKQRVAGG